MKAKVYADNVSIPLRYGFFLAFLAVLLPLSVTIGVVRVYGVDLILLPLLYVFFTVAILGNAKMDPPWSVGEKALFVLPLVMSVGLVFSADFVNTLDGVLVWTRAIVFYAMLRMAFGYGIIGLRHWRRWWSFFGVFLLAIGLVQFITASDFGLVANYFGTDTDQQTYFLDQFRVSGTSRNSNIYGTWIAIFSLLINARLLLSPEGRPLSYLYLLLAVSVELTVVLATLSRGSLLTFFVGNAVLLLMWVGFSKRAMGLRAAISIVVLAVASGVTFVFYERFEALTHLIERIENNSDSERIAMFNYGLELLTHPKVFLIGTGMQAFFPALLEYSIGTQDIITWQDFSTSITGIHNVFMLLLVEGGIFAMLLFAVFYFFTLNRALRLMRAYKDTRHHAWSAYLFAIVLTLLVPMQLYNNFVNLSVLIIALSIAAVVNGLEPPLSGKQRQGEQRSVRGARDPRPVEGEVSLPWRTR